jgi:hypothetical protein
MSAITALFQGTQWLVRPHRGERHRRAGRPAYGLVRGKDVSAFPVCGQAVRPLSSQQRQPR